MLMKRYDNANRAYMLYLFLIMLMKRDELPNTVPVPNYANEVRCDNIICS